MQVQGWGYHELVGHSNTTLSKRICLKFFQSQAAGMQKLAPRGEQWRHHSCPSQLVYFPRFLPPANEVWGKVMFYMCLSFCSQEDGGLPRGGGVLHPSGGDCIKGDGGLPSGGLGTPPIRTRKLGAAHPAGMLSCYYCNHFLQL